MKFKKQCSLVLLVSGMIFSFSCTHTGEKKAALNKPKGILKSDTIKYFTYKTWIIIPGIVNKVKVRLLFDTGAGGDICLDSALVRTAGWIDKKYYPDSGSARDKRIKAINGMNEFMAKNFNITVGQLNYTSSFPTVFNIRRITDNRADGIIGLAFIKNYILEINYEKRFVVFHKPDFFTKPLDAIKIPVEYKGAGFLFTHMNFKINDKLSLDKKVVIDLGYSPRNIGWGTYAVNSNNLLKNIVNKTAYKPVRNKTMTGELLTGYTAAIKAISLDNKIMIDTPKLLLHTSTSGVSSNNIICVGNYIFSRYKRVYFDMNGRMLYIIK